MVQEPVDAGVENPEKFAYHCIYREPPFGPVPCFLARSHHAESEDYDVVLVYLDITAIALAGVLPKTQFCTIPCASILRLYNNASLTEDMNLLIFP